MRDKDDNTKTENDRLVHPHNMIWINITKEKGLQEIDEYKLVKYYVYGKYSTFSYDVQIMRRRSWSLL